MTGSITEDRGTQITSVNYVMLVLATLAVALRFWARYIAHKAGFWWDDWTSLAALPFIWANCALSIYWVSVGLGKHISQVPGPHSRLSLTLFVVNQVYNTGLTLVRISVLLFYCRVFQTVRVYRVSFWIVGAILLGWGITFNFLAIFTCVPVNKSWKPNIPGHCLNTHHTFLGATISNVLADFILLVLPMPMLWQLHIDTPRKFGLAGVFAAGYCVIVLSILRLVSIVNLGDKLQQDISWNLAGPQILVTCEVSIALISSCLPSIFNLIKHATRRYFSSLFSKLNPSNPVGGPGGSRIGPMGNPIDNRRNNGFIQLQSGILNTGVSNARGFDSMVGVDHYTTASTAEQNHDYDHQNLKLGSSLHQIHVREDVEVHA